MERVGTFIVSAGNRVADESPARRKRVQAEARRLQRPVRGSVGSQIQTDLMRWRGYRDRERSAKAYLDGAMHVTADHTLNVRMLGHECFERSRTGHETDSIHMTDQGLEGWVVHGNDYWSIAVFIQLPG